MDDEAALQSSNDALSRRREDLGLPAQGPDRVELHEVDHYVENI